MPPSVSDQWGRGKNTCRMPIISSRLEQNIVSGDNSTTVPSGFVWVTAKGIKVLQWFLAAVNNSYCKCAEFVWLILNLKRSNLLFTFLWSQCCYEYEC